MSSLNHLHQALRQNPTLGAVGRVASACGTVIKVTGIPVRVGTLCRLYNDNDRWSLNAEVVGLVDDCAVLTPLGSVRGITSRTRVSVISETQTVPVGQNLLGRVLDANALPLDNHGPLNCGAEIPLYAAPPNPLTRLPIETPATTGVRAIDSLLTCGVGQRTGIFATAGGGKSTLMSMLARGSQADINVVALIGERGREVTEFIEDGLGQALERSVVVVATADCPPLERARATFVATAIAEFFRDQGLHVQLLVDSVTRFARALRDVGLAAGEPPTRRGFPPSVFSVLPQLFERVGTNKHGAITAFFTVLVEDEDSSDPIAEEVRSLLDGHICLSRALAAKTHYPAIDILSSASRLMNKLVSPEHHTFGNTARELLAKHAEIEILVQLGEYQSGNDPVGDRALACAAGLRAHLCQTPDEHVSLRQSIASLEQAIRP